MTQIVSSERIHTLLFIYKKETHKSGRGNMVLTINLMQHINIDLKFLK